MKLPLFILAFVLFSTTSKLNYLFAHIDNENISLHTESTEKEIDNKISEYKSLFESEETEKAIEKALQTYEFAKKFNQKTIQRKASSILVDVGNMYSSLKKYEDAIKIFNQVLEMEIKQYGPDSEEVLAMYWELAYVNNEIDNFNEKMKFMEKGELIMDKIDVKDKNLEFNFYMLFVHSYIYYGDMEMAKVYLKKMNDFYETHKNDQEFTNSEEDKNLEIKNVFSNYLLANLRIHIIEINQNEVRKYFNLLESQLDKTKTDYAEEDLHSINNLYIQMALYYTRYLNDYEGAIPYFEEVLALNKKNDFQWGIIDVSYFFAFHYMHFKEWDKAINYLKSCLENPEYENYTYAVTIHQNLGSSYFYNCEFNNAIEHFDIMMDTYETQSETYQGVYAMRDLYELGNIYLEIYEDTKDMEILKKAYKAFQMSSKLFSSVYQGNIYNDYLSIHQGFITKGLLYCAFILKEKQSETLELIETNNSDFLWTNFITKQDKNFLHSPIELKDKIYQLEQALNSIENEIKNAKNPETKKELQRQKDEKEKNLKELNNQLQVEYKSFYNFTKSGIDTHAIQSKMDSDEVIVKYIVTDNALYAFKITKKDVEIKKMRVSDEYLQQQVLAYISELKQRSYDYQNLSKHLHQILISNLNLESYEKIVFISDTFLSYLPFETLMDNSGEFLLNKHQISYSNSLKLLNIQQIDEEKPDVKFIAFSPDYSNENSPVKDSGITRDKNYELLGAKKEAKEISTLFDGDLYVNQNATKSNFLKKAKDYNFIHLAMHAVVDEEDSNLSNLIFQNGEKLYFKEFYEIDIPAQMVALSACNTGVGNIKDGEGVVSLSRAFTFAGVKSTLMSLWQIPDKETPEIMFSFYENLKNGKTNDEALREAKLNYIQNTKAEELKHPYYWAGFVISGDTSALSGGFPVIIYWIGGLVLLILLFLLLIKLIKNQSNFSNNSSASSIL